MAHRYSRQEKGKWVSPRSQSQHSRRSPIRILEEDTASLIAQHHLTLIGKVTNPLMQRPQEVVEYLPLY
ncbi:unnamed protein product [Arabis nemorensis]|uniref:Uncharacterized protein n=1 Tax=Arabis nemorensis TaxID=586526 RepID=A0A565CCH0_9BRAS|nr:unnamed protein product [Arabis nemorensis]